MTAGLPSSVSCGNEDGSDPAPVKGLLSMGADSMLGLESAFLYGLTLTNGNKSSKVCFIAPQPECPPKYYAASCK